MRQCRSSWAHLMSESAVVIGAGGHAKVVLVTLEAAGVEVTGVFDDDPGLWGREILGCFVKGPVKEAAAACRFGVLAIGSNRERARLANEIPLEWLTAVHPAARIDSSVELGPGTVVFAGATLQPGTVVGAHAIVNTGALVDHDCRVGSYPHVAPRVALSGGVSLGAGVLMGVGSCAIPGVSVGDWAVVGAGAAVVTDIESDATAVGVPAKVVRGS